MATVGSITEAVFRGEIDDKISPAAARMAEAMKMMSASATAGFQSMENASAAYAKSAGQASDISVAKLAAIAVGIGAVVAAYRSYNDYVSYTERVTKSALSGMAEAWTGLRNQVRDLVQGSYLQQLSEETRKLSQANADLARSIGTSEAQVTSFNRATAQMGLNQQQSTTVLNRLSEVLDGTGASADEARKTIEGYGVSLRGLTSADSLRVLGDYVTKLNEIRDSRQKSADIALTLGTKEVAVLRQIAQATNVAITADQKRADVLNAEFQLRQRQIDEAVAKQRELENAPGPLMKALKDLFTVSETTRASLNLIFQEGNRQSAMADRGGILGFFRGLRADAEGAYTVVRDLGKLMLGLYDPTIQTDTRRAAPASQDQIRQVEAFTSRFDVMARASAEYRRNQEELQKAEKSGLLTLQQRIDLIEAMGRAYARAINPLKAITEALNDEADLARLQGPARERERNRLASRRTLGLDPGQTPNILQQRQLDENDAAFARNQGAQAGESVARLNRAVEAQQRLAEAAKRSGVAMERARIQAEAYEQSLSPNGIDARTYALKKLAEADARRAEASNTAVRIASQEISASMAVAEGYQESTAAGLRAEAVQRRIIDVKEGRIAAGTAEAVAQADLNKLAWDAIAAGEKQLATMQEEADQQKKLADASAISNQALQQAQIEQKATQATAAAMNAAIASGTPLAVAEVEKLRDSYRGLYADADLTQKRIQINGEIQDARDRLTLAKRELELVGALPEIRERELALLQEKQRLQKAYGDALPKEQQELLRIAEAQGQVTGALKEAERQQRLFDDAIKNAANSIDRTITKSLEDIFDGKRVNDWGKTFSNVLKQLAVQLINIYAIRPAIGAGLQAMGFDRVARDFGYAGVGNPAAGGGQSGGMGMLSNVGGLSNLFGGNSSGGLFGGITSSIDAFGYNSLGVGTMVGGTAPLATAAGGYGAADLAALAAEGSIMGAGGTLGTGTTAVAGGLSSGIGGAAIPVIGAALPGLISGNYKQAAFGAGGAAVGAAIGSIIPGIGTMIGAMIGGMLGNMFGGGGKKEGFKGSGYLGVLHPDGMINDGEGGFSSKGADDTGIRKLISDTMQPFMKGIVREFGAVLPHTTVGAEISNKNTRFSLDRGPEGGGQAYFDFDPEKAESVSDALARMQIELLRMSTGLDETTAKIIKNTNAITAAQLAADLKFGRDFQNNLDTLKLGSVDFESNAGVKAREATRGVVGKLTDFMDSVSRLFPDDVTYETRGTGRFETVGGSIVSGVFDQPGSSDGDPGGPPDGAGVGNNQNEGDSNAGDNQAYTGRPGYGQDYAIDEIPAALRNYDWSKDMLTPAGPDDPARRAQGYGDADGNGTAGDVSGASSSAGGSGVGVGGDPEGASAQGGTGVGGNDGGSSNPFDPTGAGAGTTREITEQVEISRVMSEEMKKAREATKRFLDVFIGLEEQDISSPFVEAIDAIDAKMKAAKPFLEQFGYTAEEIARATQIQMDKMKEDFDRAFGFIGPKAEDGPAVKAIKAARDQVEAAESAFRRFGYTTQEIWQAMERTVQKAKDNILQGLGEQVLALSNPGALATAQRMKEFNAALKDLREAGIDDSQLRRVYALKDAEAELGRERERQTTQLQEQIQLTQQAVSGWDALARSLEQARLGFLTDANLSPLSPLDRLTEARRQAQGAYDRTRDTSLTLAERIEAGNQLPQLVRTMLEASRGYNASGPGYVSDFDLGQTWLTDTKTYAEAQLEIAEKSLEIQKAQLDRLTALEAQAYGDIWAQAPGTDRFAAESALGISLRERDIILAGLGYKGENAGAGGREAFITQNAAMTQAYGDAIFRARRGEGLFAQAPGYDLGAVANTLGVSLNQYDELMYMLGYKGENAATGGRAAFRANPQNSLDLTALLRAARGYAGGGEIEAGQVARIHSNELLYTGPAARVFNPAETAAIFSRGGTNDNSALVQQQIRVLEAICRNQERQISQMAAAMTALIEASTEQAEAQRKAATIAERKSAA